MTPIEPPAAPCRTAARVPLRPGDATGSAPVAVSSLDELVALAGSEAEPLLVGELDPAEVVAAVVVAHRLGLAAVHTVQVRAARRAVAVLEALAAGSRTQ